MKAKVKRPWGLQLLFGFPRYTYCGNCGEPIYGQPNFCGKCCAELEWDRCPGCNNYLDKRDELYCTNCGSKLEK